VIIFLFGCGKKGPLRLEPELIPKAAEKLKVFQIGDNLKLEWDFPQVLADKNRTELEIAKIDKIYIYYSTREILGGKFRKKSTLLKKLKIEESIILLQSKFDELKNKLKKLTEEVSLLINETDAGEVQAEEESFEMQAGDQDDITSDEKSATGGKVKAAVVDVVRDKTDVRQAIQLQSTRETQASVFCAQHAGGDEVVVGVDRRNVLGYLVVEPDEQPAELVTRRHL
jgi:FtsZ-binding cell division protein ZapB